MAALDEGKGTRDGPSHRGSCLLPSLIMRSVDRILNPKCNPTTLQTQRTIQRAGDDSASSSRGGGADGRRKKGRRKKVRSWLCFHMHVCDASGGGGGGGWEEKGDVWEWIDVPLNDRCFPLAPTRPSMQTRNQILIRLGKLTPSIGLPRNMTPHKHTDTAPQGRRRREGQSSDVQVLKEQVVVA